MRRDAYAAHVRAKHMKDIALLLLDDFKESNITVITAYASEKDTSSMPIYSKMYQDAEYWFGVKPYFYIRESNEVPYDATRPDAKLKSYPEDEELRQYLKREENMRSHRLFVEEALQSISLLEFITLQKNLVVRHPDVINTKKELSALRGRYATLEESSKKDKECLQRELEMWKETADEKEFIGDLKRELQSSRSHVKQLTKEVSYFKSIKEEIEKEHNEHWTELNMNRLAESRKTEAIEDALRKEVSDLKAQVEKSKNDVKKEAQKLFDKEHEAKQRAKEKKAIAKAKAKKLAKKAKKLAEMSDSDSSDSDSDSD